MKTKRQIRRNRKVGDTDAQAGWNRIQRRIRWKAIGERALMVGLALWVGWLLGIHTMMWLGGRV